MNGSIETKNPKDTKEAPAGADWDSLRGGLTNEEVLLALNGGKDEQQNTDKKPIKGGGKRLAKGTPSVGERIRRMRKDWGYTGKRVMGAMRPEAEKADSSETDTDAEDEEKLEEAFHEVTIDDVLAEELPEEKTPVEQVAEKLGRVRLAEVVIGAINESREREGQYYDYLQGKADEYEVDYDDLLQLVRERVKSGYEDKKDQIKFYYSLSREDFVKAAKAGKLERADRDEDEYNHRPSDLRFSQDTVIDGEVVLNGFGEERGAKSDEVTLIFGGDLVDELSFDSLLPGVVGVDGVDLRKCLAVVSREKGLSKVLSENNLPVVAVRDNDGETSWRKQNRDVAALRKIKVMMVEKLQKKERLQREALTEVDKDGVREQMRPLAEKFKPEEWDEVFERFRDCETDAAYEAAEKDTFAKFLDVLGVKGAAEVRYMDDPEDTRGGYLSVAKDEEGYRMFVTTINRHHVPLGAITRSLEVIGHESAHAWQVDFVERSLGGEELSEEDKKWAELYDYNIGHYIPAKVDKAGYREQLIEVGASAFGEACVDAFYERYEAVHKTPLQKVIEGLQELFKRPEATTVEESEE